MPYRWSFGSILAATLLGLAALAWTPGPGTFVLLGGALACLWVGAIVACLGFARLARAPAQGACWWAGSLFIVGAAAADVGATLWHSPDLSAEENVFAALLIDGLGLGVPTVLAWGAAAQLGVLVFSLGMWRNFACRRVWYLECVHEALSQGTPIWPAMFGMKDGGLASWLGFGARSDVATTAIGFYIPALFAYRAYLAMEWMGWAPYSRMIAPAIALFLAGVVHLAWVRWRLRLLRSEKT